MCVVPCFQWPGLPESLSITVSNSSPKAHFRCHCSCSCMYMGLVPVLARFGCALDRLAGLSARGCSVGRVLVDLLCPPCISGAPSAEGTSLDPSTVHSCQLRLPHSISPECTSTLQSNFKLGEENSSSVYKLQRHISVKLQH